jgi:uncharacterized membrane protein
MNMPNANFSVFHLTTKRFAVLILSSQLALLVLVGLDKLGLEVPILRQILGFIYLTFIPGFVVLKALKISELNSVEELLYSVGLSLSFVMFVGIVMNCLYPIFQISKPISETPLIVTISSITFIISCILFNKDRLRPFSINMRKMPSPSFLSLSLLPFLAVFGTYLLNFYDNNFLLLILLAIVSTIPLLAVFDKVPSKEYPFAIWAISISLLLHNSLIGHYVSWGDSEGEYLVSNFVLMNGSWDRNVSTTTNSLLSLAFLYPAYSIICNLELTWVFKIIYPLLFSLTPVALYLAFKERICEKSAFLSSSLFMFSHVFFTLLSRNTRTGLSLFFLSLLILLIMNDKMNKTKKTALAMAFVLAVVVTYYGVSYMLLTFLPLVVLLDFLLDRKSSKNNLITPTFTILFFSFTIAWYMYTSNFSGFDTMVKLGKDFVNGFAELLGVPRSSPTYYLLRRQSISLEITKYLYLVFTFFIAIGVLDLTYRMVREKRAVFPKDYSLLSIVLLLLLLATLLPLPWNAQRTFQVTLIFLAPFSVLGFTKLFSAFTRIFRRSLSQKSTLGLFSLLLLIFLIFNSGLASATITKDLNPNILINKKHVEEEGDAEEKAYFYAMYLPSYDVYSSKWLLGHVDGRVKIYHGGMYHFGQVAYHYGLNEQEEIKSYLIEDGRYTYRKLSSLLEGGELERDSYLHIGFCVYKEGLVIESSEKIFKISEIYPTLNKTNKIYSNGGSIILRVES